MTENVDINALVQQQLDNAFYLNEEDEEKELGMKKPNQALIFSDEFI